MLQRQPQRLHQHQPPPQGRKRRRTPSMASLVLAASIAGVLAGRGESSTTPLLARGGRSALNQGLTATSSAPAPAPAATKGLAFAFAGSFEGSAGGGRLTRALRRADLARNMDVVVGQCTSSRRVEGVMLAAKGKGKAQGSSGTKHKPPSLPQVRGIRRCWYCWYCCCCCCCCCY